MAGERRAKDKFTSTQVLNRNSEIATEMNKLKQKVTKPRENSKEKQVLFLKFGSKLLNEMHGIVIFLYGSCTLETNTL